MMGKNRIIAGVGAVVAMMILILDSQTASKGAYEGIQLCMSVVIPSLFPFLILSGVITETVKNQHIPLLKPIGKLYRIPSGAEPLLLIGLIGGYPVGAKCISNAKNNHILTEDEAQRMLGFCNNAGPAFIFGMTSHLFENRLVPWLLWLIHILSALIVSTILPVKDSKRSICETNLVAGNKISIASSVRTMGIICAWIVLFRIVIIFCKSWFLWLLPKEISTLIQGMLELSNGCIALGQIDSEALRFILCSTILAFGGICVWMQTISVSGNINRVWYLPGKLLQTGISCFVATIASMFLYQEQLPFWVVAFVAAFGVITALCGFCIRKKSSSIRQECVV